MDGEVEIAPWGRPQHDGPALRALAIMSFVKEEKSQLSLELLKIAKETIATDMGHLSYAFRAKGFDLWEFAFGHHFFTGLVQLSAFTMAKNIVPEFGRKEWPIGSKEISERLSKQWDPKLGYYRYSSGTVNDAEGFELLDLGDRLDASMVLAINASGRRAGPLSLRDPKVMASLAKLEAYFREQYPINRDHPWGPAIGRHAGDDYFGGNPWYLLTAGFGEYYYRLGADIKNHSDPVVVDSLNKNFFENVMGRELQLKQNLVGNDSERAELLSRLLGKGDAFIETVLSYMPANGMLSEQFDQRSGHSVSGENLSWSYSSFLSAALEREEMVSSEINFSKLPMDCTHP